MRTRARQEFEDEDFRDGDFLEERWEHCRFVRCHFGHLDLRELQTEQPLQSREVPTSFLRR
jgi:hypothetical protein